MNRSHRTAINHLCRQTLKIFSRNMISRTRLTASLPQRKLVMSCSQLTSGWMVRQGKYTIDRPWSPVSTMSALSEQTSKNENHSEKQGQETLPEKVNAVTSTTFHTSFLLSSLMLLNHRYLNLRLRPQRPLNKVKAMRLVRIVFIICQTLKSIMAAPSLFFASWF